MVIYPLQMVIFHSYVSLPEGIYIYIIMEYQVIPNFDRSDTPTDANRQAEALDPGPHHQCLG